MGGPQPHHRDHFVPVLKAQPEIYKTEITKQAWSKIQPRLTREDMDYIRVPRSGEGFTLFTTSPLSFPEGDNASTVCDNVDQEVTDALLHMPIGNGNVSSCRRWSVREAERSQEAS